jgi:hypothetical protein
MCTYLLFDLYLKMLDYCLIRIEPVLIYYVILHVGNVFRQHLPSSGEYVSTKAFMSVSYETENKIVKVKQSHYRPGQAHRVPES